MFSPDVFFYGSVPVGIRFFFWSWFSEPFGCPIFLGFVTPEIAIGPQKGDESSGPKHFVSRANPRAVSFREGSWLGFCWERRTWSSSQDLHPRSFPHPENVKPIGNSPAKTIKRIILANILKTNFQRFFSRCSTAGQLEFDVEHSTAQKGANLPREHGILGAGSHPQKGIFANFLGLCFIYIYIHIFTLQLRI